MKLSLPGASSLLSALRSRLQIGGSAQVAAPDPRQLVGANDPVTGLIGLPAFENTLAQVIRQADAKSEQVALLFFNINDFESVNSECGRREGDRLLRQAAKRMRPLVNPFMIARLKGEEFLLLMNQDPQNADASILAAQLQAALSVPFDVEHGHAPTLTCSIGLAMYPEHGARSTCCVICAVPLNSTSSSFTTNPGSTRRPARSRAPKRCSAGATRRAAWSARASSFRSRSATASSCRPAAG